MKLYLISQTENDDWDTYDSAVVCAPDEDTARLMDPGGDNGALNDFGRQFTPWALSPSAVSVKYLGEAAADIAVGIVCASFNAG